MSLTPLPTAPNRSMAQSIFTTTADAFLAALPTMVTQLNAYMAALGTIAMGGGTSAAFTFDSGTADADPGTAKLRFNNATQSSATLMSMNFTDANGQDLTTLLAVLGESVGTAAKSYARITKLADPSHWMMVKVTAYAATTFGDATIVVTHASSATPFTNGDQLVFTFTRSGDKGDKGDNGAIGLGSATQASGNVTLTNLSAGAQRVSATTWGRTITLPDATTMPTLGTPVFSIRNTGEFPMALKDNGGTVLGWSYPGETCSVALHDKSTAAGLWDVEDAHALAIAAQFSTTALSLGTAGKVQAITLDSDRVMLLFGGTSCYAMVYTRSAGTFGTPTLVRATLIATRFWGVLAATDKTLVVSEAGTPTTTSLQGVILSTAANVITVNTAAALTAAAALTGWGTAIVPFSTAWTFSYLRGTSGSALVAISVSGTTVTFGVEQGIGAATANSVVPHLYVSGTTLMAICPDRTNINAKPYTLSAPNSLVPGTAATVANGQNATFKSAAWTAGRWFALVGGSSGVTAMVGVDITLTGTVATMTTVAPGLTNGNSGFEVGIVSSTKVVICGLDSVADTNVAFNVFTDNGSGTISAGTQVVVAGSSVSPIFVGASGTTAKLVSTDGFLYSVDCSGASPVISAMQMLLTTTQISTFAQASAYTLSRDWSTLFSGALAIPLPSAGGQLSMLATSVNAQKLIPADFMPCGTAGCVGADSTESWVFISPMTNGVFLQLVKAGTPT